MPAGKPALHTECNDTISNKGQTQGNKTLYLCGAVPLLSMYIGFLWSWCAGVAAAASVACAPASATVGQLWLWHCCCQEHPVVAAKLCLGQHLQILSLSHSTRTAGKHSVTKGPENFAHASMLPL